MERDAKGRFAPKGGGKAGRIEFTTDTLTPGLIGFPVKLNIALAALVHAFAPQVESHARSTAPWTDRTSNARNGLAAQGFTEKGVRHGIALFHQVPYGIWLEVRWSGKYRVIMPTLLDQGPKVMAGAQAILGRLR